MKNKMKPTLPLYR